MSTAVPAVRLQTERLCLRAWQPADAAPWAALNADPAVCEFFLAPLTRSQSDALMARCQAGIDERGWGFWALERLADGAFVGMVGLNPLTSVFPFAPAVEIGWRLGRAHWGQGYASEAARAALAFGFEQPDLPEIVAFTALGNLRSRAVMERLQMQADSEFAHPALPEDHALRAHVLYRLPRTQPSD